MAAGDDDVFHLLRIPNGLGARKLVVRDHRVDQGHVAVYAVDEDLDALVVDADVIGVVHQGGGRGGHAGDRALHHLGVDVVGASGDGQHRGLLQRLCSRAGGTVAAEHDHAADTALLHEPGRLNGVDHGGVKGEVEHLDLTAGHFVVLQLILYAVAHGEGIRHIHGLFDAQAVGGKGDALADIDLLVVVNGGGIGHKSPDILSGLGICNNAYGRHDHSSLLVLTRSLQAVLRQKAAAQFVGVLCSGRNPEGGK